jgi:hypothetical protein
MVTAIHTSQATLVARMIQVVLMMLATHLVEVTKVFFRKSLDSILANFSSLLTDLDAFIDQNETVYVELQAEANKIGDELQKAGRVRDKLANLIK